MLIIIPQISRNHSTLGSPIIRAAIDISLLTSIIQQCDHLQFPPIFKALYLTCIFSFLRLSNLLPDSVASLDISKHMTYGDVIFSTQGAVLLIKRSKTIQDRTTMVTLPLPHPGASTICPITALQLMYYSYPGKLMFHFYFLLDPHRQYI